MPPESQSSQGPRSDQPTSVPQPLVPHVCMVCGDARGFVVGLGVPYCLNHPGGGLPMVAWPLDRLRALVATGHGQER